MSPTTSFGNQLKLRPQSVVILTDKFIETKVQPHPPHEPPPHEHPPHEQPTTEHPSHGHGHHHHTSDGTQIGSNLIYLLGVLLLTKCVL